MKSIDPGFANALASGEATTCLCWLFTRSDGARFGATDHDRDLVVDETTCAAQSGLAGAEFRTGADLAPGYASVLGALSADFLNEDDLDAGLWKGAQVDIYRVDWTTPSARAHLWSGRIGDVARSGEAFRAELVCLKADLERRIGRIYSRDCDAEIGDQRCGLDLSQSNYRAEGALDAVYSAARMSLPAAEAFPSGFFNGGRLTAPGGETVRIASHEEATLTLAENVALSIGDVVIATAGCDKRFSTCVETFSNAENFRGFPHLPGMDAVISGPAGDGSDDGGKR